MKALPLPIIMLLALVLFGAGCAGQTARVPVAAAVENPLGDRQVLDLRNCQGDQELRTTLADRYELNGRIEIDAQAVAVDSGQRLDIPAEVRDELKAQIEQAYRPEIEAVEAGLRAEQLVVPVGKIHMIHVQMTRREYRSELEFSLQGTPCRAAYTYTLDYPQMQDTWTMSCTA